VIEQRVCRLFPPLQARALRNAMDLPRDLRAGEIDRITDQLVAAGHCRPRSSESRAAEWARVRVEGRGA
jgi:hypothetical protein